MMFRQGPARIGALVAGVFALLLGLGLVTASTTNAQALPGARFFGFAAAGDTVEAFIDGVSCGSAVTADASGLWILDVESTAACNPSDGDTVTFELNGVAAEETETWRAGGTSADQSNGTTLTAAAAPATPTPAPEPVEPTPPDVGNAGLVAEQGGVNPLMALGLGALLLATLGGARAVTRRS